MLSLHYDLDNEKVKYLITTDDKLGKLIKYINKTDLNFKKIKISAGAGKIQIEEKIISSIITLQKCKVIFGKNML